jgi:hypothetical protein
MRDIKTILIKEDISDSQMDYAYDQQEKSETRILKISSVNSVGRGNKSMISDLFAEIPSDSTAAQEKAIIKFLTK